MKLAGISSSPLGEEHLDTVLRRRNQSPHGLTEIVYAFEADLAEKPLGNCGIEIEVCLMDGAMVMMMA